MKYENILDKGGHCPPVPSRAPMTPTLTLFSLNLWFVCIVDFPGIFKGRLYLWGEIWKLKRTYKAKTSQAWLHSDKHSYVYI